MKPFVSVGAVYSFSFFVFVFVFCFCFCAGKSAVQSVSKIVQCETSAVLCVQKR